MAVGHHEEDDHGGDSQYAWKGLMRRSIDDIHEVYEEVEGEGLYLDLETSNATTGGIHHDQLQVAAAAAAGIANTTIPTSTPTSTTSEKGSAQSHARVFIDKLLKKIEDDNRRLLLRLQNRLHR